MRGRLRWLLSGALLVALLLSTAGQSFAGSGGGNGPAKVWNILGSGSVDSHMTYPANHGGFQVGGAVDGTALFDGNTPADPNIQTVVLLSYAEAGAEFDVSILGVALLPLVPVEKSASPGGTPQAWLGGIGVVQLSKTMLVDDDFVTVKENRLGLFTLRVSATQGGYYVGSKRYPGDFQLTVLEIDPLTGDLLDNLGPLVNASGWVEGGYINIWQR